jgi:hypothetical protein
VKSVSWSPDGKTLASVGEYGTVKLWDVATGKEQATLKGHTGEVMSVSWSPDGKTLASASWDKTVKLWAVSPADASKSQPDSPNDPASASFPLWAWAVGAGAVAGWIGWKRLSPGLELGNIEEGFVNGSTFYRARMTIHHEGRRGYAYASYDGERVIYLVFAVTNQDGFEDAEKLAEAVVLTWQKQ